VQERSLNLPPFLIDTHLAQVLNEALSDDSTLQQGRVIFDCTNVCFFDDYTLLKLIFVQRHLRSLGNRVTNSGLTFSEGDANKQTVIRQLWRVGLPRLTASGHLISADQLKDALTDEAELLQTDPLCGLQLSTPSTAVVPLASFGIEAPLVRE